MNVFFLQPKKPANAADRHTRREILTMTIAILALVMDQISSAPSTAVVSKRNYLVDICTQNCHLEKSTVGFRFGNFVLRRCDEIYDPLTDDLPH